MRLIDKIVVHCAATPPSMDIGAEEIDRWHKEKGWNRIGYHFVVRRDGTVERGRNPWEQGAHARGFNASTIGICLAGGVDENNKAENNFTKEQFDALAELILETQRWYGPLEVVGHRDLPGVKKDCPSFDVKMWLAAEGL